MRGAAAAGISEPLSRRAVVVTGLLCSVFLAALEATVVATAMPTVIAELGGVEHYSWVFSAYLLASTVTVPVYGKLADLYGRKPLLLFGIALFLVGSMASGLSRSMTELIAYRAVQGLGAGAIQPITLTLVGDLFTLEQRARTQGVFSAVWGVAGLAGPLIGGLIVSHLSWRWVFFINVPFGFVSAVLIVAALREEVAHRRHALDLAGAVLLTAGVLALLTTTSWGLAAAALLLAAFVWVERRAAEPVLPLDLFRRRAIWVSSVANGLNGAAQFTAVTFVPLYVQGVLAGSPIEAGATITPMTVGWPVASALTGRLLPRLGFRPFIRLGLAVSAAAAASMALLLGRDVRLIAQIAMFVFGMGLGFSNTALLVAVQTVVPWRERGVVTATTMFFRTIGGALAIGAMGSYLTASVGPHADEIQRLLAAAAAHGSARLGADALGPLRAALQAIFWMFAGLSALAVLVGLRFPYVPSRQVEHRR